MNVDIKLRPETVQNWTAEQLAEWLKRPRTMETWEYDFKDQLPGRGEDSGKQRLRQEFCAYANAKGGFFFFGIYNDRQPKGLPHEKEFMTKLGNIVNEKVLPIIRTHSLINCIQMSEDRYVYVVFVRESSYFDKPHITDNQIFIRLSNGKKAVNDGKYLREMLELEKFSPVCIEPLEKEAKKIKEIRHVYNDLDLMYFIKLREYLALRRSESTEFQKLLQQLQKIIEIYAKNKDERGSASSAYDPSALETDEELGAAVDSFLEKYKDIHKL